MIKYASGTTRSTARRLLYVARSCESERPRFFATFARASEVGRLPRLCTGTVMAEASGEASGDHRLGVLLLGLQQQQETPADQATDTRRRLALRGQTLRGLDRQSLRRSRLQETIAQTCALTVLLGGACVERACFPQPILQRGAIWKGTATARKARSSNRCTSGLFCRADDGGVSCSPRPAPPETRCVKATSPRLPEHGSGPGRAAPTAPLQAPLLRRAVPRRRLRRRLEVCQHDDVYQCGANGTDLSLWQNANRRSVRRRHGSCRARVCDPGKVQCD